MKQQVKKDRIILISFIGLMAALCMVSNYLQIPIPLGGMDKTRIHLGNVFCLLAGYLLGGVNGGLAAGIGAAIFDLTDPMFAPEFYLTFCFKFLMAFTCGMIAYAAGKKGKCLWLNAVAGVAGQLAYLILYLGKTFVVKYWVEGNALEAALVTVGTKAVVSLINGGIAVIVAIPLAMALQKALEAARLDRYFHNR